MEFFKQNTTIDFMGIRKWTALFSALIFIWSILGLCLHSLNFGLDFLGGTQIELSYQKPANLPQIRLALAKAGYTETVVQSYGTSEDVLISLRQSKGIAESALTSKINRILPDAKVLRIDFVGPQVGSELATHGALALLVSLIATMIYIAVRFEYRFAVSSALALIHDPMLILGVFSWFQIEFNLPALAALLAVIGYSLNDTIVIFDRVRENFRKARKKTSLEVMNLSINQTLSRTIMTSGLTLIAIICLLTFGGEMLRGFSIAMAIGIIVGTYSSIYVAGALALWMGLNRKDFLPPDRTELEARP
jgi:preprotein translocase subunit SecF